MRRPTGLAWVYIFVSAVLAAVVMLTKGHEWGLLVLLALNLRISGVAYILVIVITVVGDRPGTADYLWVRAVCYLIWMMLVVVQASGFQALRREMRAASAARRALHD